VAKVAKNTEADAAVKILVEHLDLTPRQAEVLHWVAEGKTNQEISIITACSFFTVKNHLKSIFDRLGVHSRVAAAACCYRVLVAVQLGGKPPKRPKCAAPTRASRPVRRSS
jgi:DNA-binding CsgD family transcriptional regulator